MATTKTYYRVRPESNSYSPEDFDTLEEALERANKRNSLRITDYNNGTVWKGDNCKIQKVTVIVEEITV